MSDHSRARRFTREEANNRATDLSYLVAKAPEERTKSVLSWAAYQLNRDGILGPKQARDLACSAMAAGLSEHEAVTTVMSAAKGAADKGDQDTVTIDREAYEVLLENYTARRELQEAITRGTPILTDEQASSLPK